MFIVKKLWPSQPCSLFIFILDVPVNGNWSEWSTWSACSVTSGDGSQSRIRSCNSPPPSNGGNDCMGVNTEDKFCNIVLPGMFTTIKLFVFECNDSSIFKDDLYIDRELQFYKENYA